MNKTENIFLQILNIFANFVLLNALWIIFCIPIITIFPSTSALFSVTRTWFKEGIDFGLISLFFKSFKRNFIKSFLIGIMWTVAALILYIDFSILFQVEFIGKYVVFILLVFSLIIFTFISLYIFFIITSNQSLSIMKVIKHSLILSVSNLLHTILSLIIIILLLVLIYQFPILLIIFGSMTSFVLTFIFLKLEKT